MPIIFLACLHKFWCSPLQHEMIPNLVQMVFHVCVGGCDGCLNLDEPDNKGEVTWEGNSCIVKPTFLVPSCVWLFCKESRISAVDVMPKNLIKSFTFKGWLYRTPEWENSVRRGSGTCPLLTASYSWRHWQWKSVWKNQVSIRNARWLPISRSMPQYQFQAR